EPRLLELGMQQHATGHLADGDNVVVAEARERTGPINQPVDLRALGVDLVKLDVLGGLDLVGLSEDETRDDREQRGARSLHAIHFGFLRSAAARVEARARPVAYHARNLARATVAAESCATATAADTSRSSAGRISGLRRVAL